MKKINIKKIIKNIDFEKLIEKPTTKIVLALLVLLLVIIPLWYKKSNENKKIIKRNYETFAHTQPGIIGEVTFQNLKFDNISLITDKGYTSFNADVTNIGDKESETDSVYVDLKDKNGGTSISLKVTIGKLKPGEKTQIRSTAKGKFKEVTSKSIREYKN